MVCGNRMMTEVTELTEAMAFFRMANIISFRKMVIPKSELMMLVYIAKYMDEDIITPVMLSSIFHCSKAYITRTLNSLEIKGFIGRTVNLQDRRSKVIMLTPAGRDAVAEPMQQYNEKVTVLRKQLGAKKSETLCDLLKECTEILLSMGTIDEE